MRTRPGRTLLALTVVGSAALALGADGYLSSSAGRPAAKRKPASVFLSPAGSDQAGCTRKAPCRSLGRAYRRARPGQIVELAAGDYPEQSIDPAAGRPPAGRTVIFRPARGQRANVGRLSIEAGVRGIELRDLHFPDGWEVGPADDGDPAADIVFRRTSGTVFNIMNGRRVRVLGGSYGPSVDTPAQIKVYNPDSANGPEDVVVSGVRFHDFTRSADDVHTECLQIYAGLRVTIRGNRFSNCDGTGSLALTTVGQSRLRDVLVENNWFDDRGDAFYSVQADQSVENLVFRYNSSLKAMTFTECTRDACGTAQVVANLMPFNGGACVDSATYERNVFQGGRCGSSDMRVSRLGFVDPSGFDLHISRGSPALCRGAEASLPRTDIDGQRRGRSRRPDAGADQLQVSGDLPGRCRVAGS
jgi:hypothetical protein